MKALFIFAHPDDESFSSGGTISQLVKKGLEVKLITLTKGEAGLCGTPPICQQVELGRIREAELRKAAKILGISKIYFLGFIDATLKRKSTKKISQKILKILNEENPDIVITFNKDGGSYHPDHIKTSKAATLAFKNYIKTAKKHVRLYYTVSPRSLIEKLAGLGLVYTVFGKVRGTRDSQITTIIDITETVKTKIRALSCYRTQNKDVERFLKRREVMDSDSEYFKLILENQII